MRQLVSQTKKWLFLLLAVLILGGCTSQTSRNNVQSIANPAAKDSFYPRLYTDNTGTIFMSWMDQSEKQYSLNYAVFRDDAWTEPTKLASDSSWFVNWADFPAVIGHNGKPLAAHWLSKVSGGTYAYHINVTTSTKTNRWTNAFTLHEDSSPTEHGFLSMVPATDSSFVALWLDGRQTHNRAVDEYSNLKKAMTLRAAFVHQNGEVHNRFLIDQSVCDCCNTAIAQTPNGFIAVYRNRTSEEIRDIYISRFADGKWSQGKPIHPDNWKIAACPVNGPAIDAFGETIAVAWFTGADNQPKTKLAISSDGGATFRQPIILDGETSLGRVDLNITNNTIWVSWLSTKSGSGNLHIEAYDFDGNKLSNHLLEDVSEERSAGFPQITPYKNKLMIAYTDVSDNVPHVKTYILD